ncbi:MAG: UDP-N-acetylglucosamine 2-epimerase (non-hydrolyzing) [Candidatus Thorarchaeota archaeon]|nr:UDP-N-acetylglucosamine 2-epimerase (non-hydrolyzing) [Candidatus Thorarchaeota archaeon]
MEPFLVVGTRPEIIKMTPIIHAWEKKENDLFLLHTGQHYSSYMSDAFFQDMDLREPDKNLNIGSGSHSEQTAKALLGIEEQLQKVKPPLVVVQGDTNAVLSAALAAVKLNIPVAHVEAGLRSFDIRMPEEHNRRLTDHASTLLFAPTTEAAQTLERENVWGEVYVTGNTVIDAVERYMPIALKKRDIMDRLDIDFEEYALLTLHRAENVDDPSILKGLIEGILQLDANVVFSTHPRTVARLEEFGLMKKVESSKHMILIEPVPYLDFLKLMHGSSYILTDSGGIQEEATAPSLSKRVFVLRTSTERPEAVDSGYAHVVGVTPEVFPNRIKTILHEPFEPAACPYGNGNAAKKITRIMVQRYEK